MAYRSKHSLLNLKPLPCTLAGLEVHKQNLPGFFCGFQEAARLDYKREIEIGTIGKRYEEIAQGHACNPVIAKDVPVPFSTCIQLSEP